MPAFESTLAYAPAKGADDWRRLWLFLLERFEDSEIHDAVICVFYGAGVPACLLILRRRPF
jgi:hypothetical protein